MDLLRLLRIYHFTVQDLVQFLALLDYLSRAHEIEIRPLSVVHPSPVRVTSISEPNARISFKFWLLLPLGFVFVNMGPYGSENF